MQTVTQQINIYTFDELSREAKDYARNSLNNFEYYSEATIDYFNNIANLIGFYDVTPRYSGFYSQGDGASFTGSYRYNKGSAKLIMDYAPKDAELNRIAKGIQSIQKNNFYSLRANLTSFGNYQHENLIMFELYDYDNENKHITQKDDFVEYCKDLMRWLYKSLEMSYEDCNSDEYILEHCVANDYKFDINGSII